ncbi:MAG: hypothetical protein QM764_18725 [Chitinophagaceae bacterium]
MKRIATLSFITFLFSISFVHAQILKKDLLIGGSVGLSSNGSNTSSTSTNANISPRIGYAIGNNSVLYTNFGYSYYRSGGGTNISNGFNVGASWKRFISLKERIGLYTSLNGSFYRSTNKTVNGAPPEIYKLHNVGYTASIIPGFYYMPAYWLILNVDAGGINYNYSKYSNNTTPASRSSAFSVNFLSTFTFGVDFIISKKKNQKQLLLQNEPL